MSEIIVHVIFLRFGLLLYGTPLRSVLHVFFASTPLRPSPFSRLHTLASSLIASVHLFFAPKTFPRFSFSLVSPILLNISSLFLLSTHVQTISIIFALIFSAMSVIPKIFLIHAYIYIRVCIQIHPFLILSNQIYNIRFNIIITATVVSIYFFLFHTHHHRCFLGGSRRGNCS